MAVEGISMHTIDEAMETMNEQVGLLQEQVKELKGELEKCQNNIISLEEDLAHRNNKLAELGEECLDSKIKCRKAEEESSSHRAKVGALEKDLAKSKQGCTQMKKEFQASKDRITQLEDRCEKLEAINDLLEKLKDDLTFKRLTSEHGTDSNQDAREEKRSESKPLELPLIEGEESLDAAFKKCQKLVSDRQVLLCEGDLITSMAHERKAGESQGAAWNLGAELGQNFEQAVAQKLQSLQESQEYATTTAKNEFIKMCKAKFASDTQFFYVKTQAGQGKILAITDNKITEMDYSNGQMCRECKVDDVREIRLKDPDNLQLVVKRKSISWKSNCLDIWVYSFKNHHEILQALYGQG